MEYRLGQRAGSVSLTASIYFEFNTTGAARAEQQVSSITGLRFEMNSFAVPNSGQQVFIDYEIEV